ncbi:potassium transporter [Sulfurifustis variabilis]|uniref:Potassium transporter n=1 Tax=Sulfurifustis variabilis TaxID=1675686 RepID=A0A1B4V148_9GAMM|nr:monovalent cation:proton antiporter family protein [Sulfurifustis variabilis]BAU47208.1 potassium transporter [Sulfurifustis variabilis]
MNAIGFQSILLLLGLAVVLVALFRYLGLPQILAYLCAGILVGPSGLGWIPSTEEWRYFAEFGLVFLMFTIGLEFSLPKLVAMRAIVFGLGGAQVLISCLAFGAVAWWFGVPGEGAIVIGGILALSSTAIVMKLLIEQLEQSSRHGRHAFGILLFQDLVVVPFLILIPTLGTGTGPESVAGTLVWVLGKSALVLGAIFVIGRWLVRPLFHRVAATRLREFFMLTVLLLTLAAAWVTEVAGLSLALGAFLAGMMLAETEYRHQVEADILPFRDILLGLFFVTVGMMLDLGVVRTQWLHILAAVAALVIFKTALIAVLGRVFGMEAGPALRTGLVLAQGGEFGFALLLQARRYEVLDEPAAQIVLAAIVLSMLLAPLIVWHNGRIARRLVPGYTRVRAANLETIRAEAARRRAHVIVCGYGRSGQNLAWMLEQENVPSLALDLDPVRVRDARDAGKPVVYGDATRRDVLEAAGLAHAAALAVSFNDAQVALRILEITRAARPEMPVIVRTMDDADLDRLLKAGATEVVPESLEGSLMMGSHVLLLLGVPVSRIVRHVRDVREDRYRMMRGFFHGEAMFGEEATAAWRERLHSVTLPPGAHAIDKSLAELDLDRLGVTVSTVRRNGRPAPPSAETRFAAGDVLVLHGSAEALEEAEALLLEG